MKLIERLELFVNFVSEDNQLDEDIKHGQLELQLINLYLLHLNLDSNQGKDLKVKFDYEKFREIVSKNFLA